MIKIIQNCYNQNKIVSFYFNRDNTELHLTGYINSYDDDEIIISHITSRGEYDGYILKHINDIYRIDYDGEYEKKIEKLYKLKEQSHCQLCSNENDTLYPLLEFSKKNELFVCLELKDNNICGIINEYNDYICLDIINEFGVENGRAVIDIDEVLTFSVDTEDEQDIRLIYNMNKNNND